MKYPAKVALLFAIAGVLFAESPFAGIWKLDLAKTKFSSGSPDKELTVTVVNQGDTNSITENGTDANGSPVSMSYTVSTNGGAAQIKSGPCDSLTVKRISARAVDQTCAKNGQQIYAAHIVVSKSGKAIRATLKGVGADGKPIAGILVYDRQ